MSAHLESGAKQRFAVLDGMRGLAALAVISDHVSSPLMDALIPGRYLAVDFFFILSGFVLTHVYADRLAAGMGALKFMRVRLIRLYPLYLAGILLGGALALLYAIKGWGEGTIAQVASSFLFALPLSPAPPALSIWPDAPFPLDGPAWSLFFELFINGAFALIFLWLTPLRTVLIALAAGLLLIPSVFLLTSRLDAGFAWSNFLGGFPHVAYAFFAGVFIYQMRSRVRLPVLPPWAAFLGLIAVFAAPVPAYGVARSFYDLAAAFVLCPALVALSADSKISGRVLRVSAFLGAMSYGVYILHVPIWGWLRLATDMVAPDGAVPGVVNVALTAAIALGATAVLTRVYDVPVRRMLMRRSPAAA
ncbi:acyltransferase family protein [Terricaulis sp.]|uniref:acyltransferase family protein n=1 Tax=Terricaulis sp. TaxID=2768686 RepID=UPI003783EBF9